MKILYLSPSLPNDFSRIRTKNIINSLLNESHSITLISLCDKKNSIYDKELFNRLDNVYLFEQKKIISLINCLLFFLFPIPLQEAYVYNRNLHHFLMKCEKDYDLIYIKRLRMVQYAKYFDKNKVIVDFTDSLTKYYERVSKKVKGFRKLLYFEEFIKHFIHEKRIIKKYKSVVCSNDEKEYLKKKLNISVDNVFVIENLIDYDKWNIKKNTRKSKTKLVFSGMMDYEPNIIAANYFINNVLCKLDNKYKLFLIGKNINNRIEKNEKVVNVGFVDDMCNELSKYDIYICPILAGSGVKNKILQAMSVGLPIISTSLGVEGIKEECKKYIFIANNDVEFIDAINSISSLSDKELETLIINQKRFVKENYDISIAAKKIRGILS